ncbi:uncharacterized protein LOC135123293 [Zophobas morio]|uniref:uncharacterized protein LOC135123293 n=1 Tax=Zophobas morio TaxID=2755281 RepID=UPI003083CEB1
MDYIYIVISVLIVAHSGVTLKCPTCRGKTCEDSEVPVTECTFRNTELIGIAKSDLASSNYACLQAELIQDGNREKIQQCVAFISGDDVCTKLQDSYSVISCKLNSTQVLLQKHKLSAKIVPADATSDNPETSPDSTEPSATTSDPPQTTEPPTESTNDTADPSSSDSTNETTEATSGGTDETTGATSGGTGETTEPSDPTGNPPDPDPSSSNIALSQLSLVIFLSTLLYYHQM